MIRVHINIVYMNTSASTEYKQSYLWWELHWCQSKEKKKQCSLDPFGAGGESIVPNPPDTQYKMEEIPQIVPS